jgi:hypothetical protein
MGCPVGGGWRGEGDVNFDVALDVKESDLSPGGLVMIVDDVAKGGREGGPTDTELNVHAALRPFARYHTDSEHAALVTGLAAESDLRMAISELTELHRAGIRTFTEAEAYHTAKFSPWENDRKKGGRVPEER